jgi:hypothetical protein
MLSLEIKRGTAVTTSFDYVTMYSLAQGVVHTCARLHTCTFESIRQSRVTDLVSARNLSRVTAHGGRFVELIFHVTNHSNCLEIVEKWVEATKKFPT